MWRRCGGRGGEDLGRAAFGVVMAVLYLECFHSLYARRLTLSLVRRDAKFERELLEGALVADGGAVSSELGDADALCLHMEDGRVFVEALLTVADVRRLQALLAYSAPPGARCLKRPEVRDFGAPVEAGLTRSELDEWERAKSRGGRVDSLSRRLR